MSSGKFKSIDEYIARSPRNVQDSLRKLRRTIREAAPDAEESISYQIPTFKLNGRLVYFAAFKDHISFYPTLSPFKKFEKELSQYAGKQTKGTVQFPIGKRIPLDLVKRIVRFRVKENLARSTLKKAPRSQKTK